MRSFQYVIKENEQNRRIDKLLADRYPDTSRTQIQKWIVNNYITINGKNVRPNYKCQMNDEVVVDIPEEQPLRLEPEDIPLSIVYEDEYLLVINKPRGMVVHPTSAHPTGTLVNGLLHYSNHLSTIGGRERPGIVHRIDKDTSGLLIVAKDDDTHRALTAQLAEKRVERIYEAIVDGVINHESGLIDAPIGRDPKNRLRMSVVDQGKPATTHFQVLNRFHNYSYVKCQLETGRTHQIRVHMDYIGHPIVGDPKYSKRKSLNFDGQALFAKKIGFTHPVLKKDMHFEIEAPIYFQELLNKLEKMS